MSQERHVHVHVGYVPDPGRPLTPYLPEVKLQGNLLPVCEVTLYSYRFHVTICSKVIFFFNRVLRSLSAFLCYC